MNMIESTLRDFHREALGSSITASNSRTTISNGSKSKEDNELDDDDDDVESLSNNNDNVEEIENVEVNNHAAEFDDNRHREIDASNII